MEMRMSYSGRQRIVVPKVPLEPMLADGGKTPDAEGRVPGWVSPKDLSYLLGTGPLELSIKPCVDGPGELPRLQPWESWMGGGYAPPLLSITQL